MALSLAVLAVLLGPTFAAWSNTDVESITACTTQYGPASNTTQYWNTWVSTDWYTTSTYMNLHKTEVLTPKPSTTTVSATSTFTYYYYPGDNMTTTVYTWTYFDSTTATQTETVPSTTTVTVSSVETLTVPTLTGFVPVASASPLAAQKTNSWDNAGDWDVEDVYWTSNPPYDYRNSYATPPVAPFDVFLPAPVNTDILWRRQNAQSGQPLKVDCTMTIQSNGFYGTSSIRQSGPRATFTRTKILATATTTSTVRTKKTAPRATEVYTISDTFYSIDTSYTTVTTTSVETTTETVYPATTSVLAACAIDNIIDSYNGYMLREPYSWLPNANYTKQQYYSYNSESINSREECCARAVVDPKTIFWRWGGWSTGCEIWKGAAGSCPAAGGFNRTSGAKVDVDVYYEPIPDQGYWSSFDVGNGACGNIGFVSLWE